VSSLFIIGGLWLLALAVVGSDAGVNIASSTTWSRASALPSRFCGLRDTSVSVRRILIETA